eukprot:CAMPEP_0113575252 /NCGR_PEP_ID=MMETSP0015_2-20120614/27585_1 /TAXON_ID=2838 /ORGANISM="Odontella" /LENGTH=60 /DNA_ID=CAMNT_0000478451 /DNA_START=96 /DNA_END=278 /DNA_ORIENTATION=+ /assembly_acc=CAM_ASM_000160
MKLAVAALLAGSATAYQAPTMTFSLGKFKSKQAAPAPAAKVSGRHWECPRITQRGHDMLS